MKIERLSKSFQRSSGTLEVLDNVDFEAPVGGITVLMGPSGCGKTTLLRIAGTLESPDEGRVVLDPHEQGPIAYLFQEPRLLPWKSVFSNVEVVLRSTMPDSAERRERVMHVLRMVDLERFARFKPDELSGGMRQRVAIARAFAYPASLMLLDEPFQGLDHPLRFALLHSFLTMWSHERRTVLFVTHEATEAVLAADRIVMLGPLPAAVVDTYVVSGEQLARRLDDPAMLELQGRIYHTVEHHT